MVSRFFKNLLLLFLILLSPNLVASGDKNGQRQEITIVMMDIPLRTALEKLSEQGKVDLVYSDELVNGLQVSCKLEAVTVPDGLRALLINTSLSFKKIGEKFVLFEQNISKVALSGVVYDAQDGDSLPDANVQLSGSTLGTVTDEEGRFHLRSVPQNTGQLKVNYLGYKEESIDLPEQIQQPLRIAMQQAPLPLETITTHPEEDTQMSASPVRVGELIINIRKIAEYPTLGETDVLQTAQLLPGVMSSNSNISLFHLRGSTPSQTMVKIDGIPLHRYGRILGLLSTVNSDILQNISIHKSGYSAAEGGGTAGLVEMRTRTADFNDLQAQVSISTLSSRALVEIPLFGRASLLFAGRKSISQNVFRSIDDLGNLTINHTAPLGTQANSYTLVARPEASFYDLFGKLAIPLGNKSLLTLHYLHSDDASRTDQLFGSDQIIVTPDTNEIFRNVSITNADNWRNSAFSATVEREWNSNLQSSLQTSYNTYASSNITHSQWNTSKQGTRDRRGTGAKINSFLLHSKQSWQLSKKHKLNFGAQFSATDISNNEIVARFGVGSNPPEPEYFSKITSLISGDSLQASGNISYEALSEEIDMVRMLETSAYLEDAWQISSNLEAQLGLRFTHFQENFRNNSFDKLEPRLNIQYRLFDKTFLKGAWGRYHQFFNRNEHASWDRSISYNEWWIMADGTQYSPGFAEHQVLGIASQHGNTDFDLEVYRKEMEGLYDYHAHLLLFDSPVDDTSPLPGQGEALGLDAVLRKETNRFGGWISYSYNQTRIHAGGEEIISSQESRHQLKIAGRLTIGLWHLSSQWFWSSGYPVSNTDIVNRIDQNGERGLPGLSNDQFIRQHRLDIALSRELQTKSWTGTVGLSVYNLYDFIPEVKRSVLYFGNGAGPIPYSLMPTYNISAQLGITPMVFFRINID